MNQNHEEFTPEEKIKNEIEFMKLKLETEAGAIIHSAPNSPIPPEVELAWFNHIHQYERLCKEAGYTTVYEFIGSPFYRNISEIVPEERATALEQLLTLMYGQGVALNYLENSYPPETIYRFITEELFEESICRYRGPEGNAVAMFCYEEFYPNHEYDLSATSEQWFESVFGEKKWYPEWLDHYYQKNIILNHQPLSLTEYSDKVISFKERYPSFLFIEKKIDSIEFDIEIEKATVKGTIQTNQGLIPFTLHFQHDFLWLISHVEMKLL